MEDMPTPYQPGSRLNIKVTEAHTITIVVEKAFTPLSSSDVLVVRCLTPLPNHPCLPLDTLMILKIYDTRYLKWRKFRERPWSLEKELKATTYRQHHDNWRDVLYNDSDPDLDGGTLYELTRYHTAIKSWTREVDANLALVNSSVSGSGVPTFYASGSLILEEPRGFVPGVLLLEYVPHTMTLGSLKDLSLLTPWYVHTLTTIIRRINELGVTHEDISRGNILVGPGSALIIDFGESITRRQGGVDKISDEEWSDIVKDSRDEHAVKVVLEVVWDELFAQASQATSLPQSS